MANSRLLSRDRTHSQHLLLHIAIFQWGFKVNPGGLHWLINPSGSGENEVYPINDILSIKIGTLVVWIWGPRTAHPVPAETKQAKPSVFGFVYNRRLWTYQPRYKVFCNGSTDVNHSWRDICTVWSCLISGCRWIEMSSGSAENVENIYFRWFCWNKHEEWAGLDVINAIESCRNNTRGAFTWAQDQRKRTCNLTLLAGTS